MGWAKRGPSGLIGTNRADSVATVKCMLEDAGAGRFGPGPAAADEKAIPAALRERGVRPVSFADWKALDKLEVARGAKAGKIREKFTRVSDMLAALPESLPAGKSPVSS